MQNEFKRLRIVGSPTFGRSKIGRNLEVFQYRRRHGRKDAYGAGRIFMRVSYINIHGVGEQPEPTGLPQPMRASPDEFKRIWQEIGKLAGAALDETK